MLVIGGHFEFRPYRKLPKVAKVATKLNFHLDPISTRIRNKSLLETTLQGSENFQSTSRLDATISPTANLAMLLPVNFYC